MSGARWVGAVRVPGVSGGAAPPPPRSRLVGHGRVVQDHARGLPWRRCPGCDRPIPAEVRRCSSRRCPEFAPIWARDTRRRLLDNLRLVKLSVMFTVTAPGQDVYPFDPEFCRHEPGVKCSGRIGCRVSRADEAAFNAAAGAAWSSLHRRAKMRADRATGFRGRLVARVWEKQRRGLAHLHGVVAVTRPEELAWAREYVNALRELAPTFGFGFVDGWEKVSRKFWPGDQAGAYLSSYFVAGRGRKASITENVQDPNLPRVLVLVGSHLTQRTGVTMRSLRLARRLWAYREGRITSHGLDGWEEVVVSCVLDRRPLPARGP